MIINQQLKKIERSSGFIIEKKTQSRFYLFLFIISVVLIGIVYFLIFDDTNSYEKSKKEDVSILELSQQADQPLNITKPSNALNHNKKPSISLVIANLGLNTKNDDWIYNLPQSVILGFSPYIDNVSGLIDNAIKLGYETMLHVPMQSARYPLTDLGPYSLLDHLQEYDNIARIDSILSKSSKIIGLYTNFDEVFTESEKNIKFFLREVDLKAIGKEKFFFLYKDDNYIKIIPSYIKKLLLPRLIGYKIDIAIPDNLSTAHLTAKLRDAESIAKSRGGSIVVIYNNQSYNQVISSWIDFLPKKGIDLIKMKDLKQESRDHDHEEDLKSIIKATY